MADKRPNILIITTDQQRTDSLSCYTNRFSKTPNLDRLAAEGVRADRAYCANPVCTPSRVSLFTGQYMSRHGAWNIGVNYPESEFMVSQRFAQAGYRTHYVGKAHFQAFLAQPSESREGHRYLSHGYDGWNGPYYGFNTVELAPGHGDYGIKGHYGEWARREAGDAAVAEWERITSRSEVNFGGQAYDSTIPMKYHNSVWTADRTIEFLKKHDPSQPFFLSVGFQDPHHPHAVPLEFEDRVNPELVPLPDYVPGELADKPHFFQEAHEGKLNESSVRGAHPMAGQGAGFNFDGISEKDIRLGRAYYYSLTNLIDHEIGRILDTLDAYDLAENTLVVFTSDHGELLGDHGLWMKGPFHYEQLIRIPLLIRWPRRIKPGLETSALISLVDIVPTCLAATGLEVPHDLDGISLLPLFDGEVDSVHPEVLVEFVDDPTSLRMKTIVTEELKLTWYLGQSYGELYDRIADPHERQNRWNDPAYADHKAQLLSRLLGYTARLEHRWSRYAYA